MDSLRFGVVADVQYADREDVGERRYRASLGRLEEAVSALRAEPGLAFVAQLGDLIDGGEDEASALRDLRRARAVLDSLEVPLVHVAGNHCLELPRAILLRELGLASGRARLDFGALRVLVVDTMEMSLSAPIDEEAKAEARAWMAAHDPEHHPRAREWNGGLGARQRAWLAAQLEGARADGRRALVLAHHPIHAGASRPKLLAWDAPEALAELQAAPPLVWLAGHEHRGGHVFSAGVHHLTLEGLVEVPVGETAWAVIEVDASEIVVEGHGVTPSRRLALQRFTL